jgi:cyclophilin family peptidyl-prolyl cis-trans isomerase
MNKKLLTLLFATLVIFQACKKDNKEDTTPVPTPVAKEKVIEIKTTQGNMYMWLYKETPLHRENFLKLAADGFYDNTTFHRIIVDFMIQGGDPNSKDNNPGNDGTGGPGYTIPAEFVADLKNVPGAVATARLPDNVNPQKASSGSQFFINVKDNAFLNNNYTVFGVIMKGMEVANKIVIQPADGNNRPFTDIKMDVNVLEKTKAEILSEYGYEVK